MDFNSAAAWALQLSDDIKANKLAHTQAGLMWGGDNTIDAEEEYRQQQADDFWTS